ncbi:MAG: hypothetical protein L3J09_08090 [Flavobacteriaceae bacterium]|nr:hypothetical protein [Flavobacteriaceae bacterium]
MEWLKKIVRRVAEEVHKSKIEELDKRVLEMEKEHKVMTKTISDSESKIKDLETKLYNSIILSTKMEATINTVLMLKEREIRGLKNGGSNE